MRTSLVEWLTDVANGDEHARELSAIANGDPAGVFVPLRTCYEIEAGTGRLVLASPVMVPVGTR